MVDGTAVRSRSEDMDIREILHHYWGYDDFRPLQRDIIESVLGGHDTLAMLPTGGGKSLCYQVPALAQDGMAVVISPLIALMRDQVAHLRAKKIKAECLTSGMTKGQIEVVLNHCLNGETKLLYVSPERLKSRVFINHLQQFRVNLIAVDEAHCVSQWGYDFRPTYLEIAKIRPLHPNVPMLALTATATPAVEEDIRLRLEFRHGNTFRGSYRRENLSYSVIHDEDKLRRLLRIVRNVGGSGIVYTRNRRRTQDIAQFLEDQGIASAAYHAGLSQKERDVKQKAWSKSHNGVMVATNAFGMGIDKADVRFVVHMDIPNSVEAYFQEAGRAGRDGQRAFAVLLYDNSDINTLRYGLERDYPPLKQITNIYRGICNYYQIPVGSGQDSQYDFEAERICDTYDFDLYTFYTATQFLVREGLIDLPERQELESRLYIPISREELYRYQVENHQAGDVLGVILRLYGGLFTDYTPILESQIARRCGLRENTICDILTQLHKHQIVDYQRKTIHPQIIFSSPRIDVANLQIGDHNYAELKKRATARVEAMLDYLRDTETCRSRQLAAYFGEKEGTDCGCCDNCLARRKEKQQTDSKQLERDILALVASRQLNIRQLSEALPHTDMEQLSAAVRTLLDKGKLRMDNWQLHVVG